MKIKILLLAGNTLRARAYAQQLQHLSAELFEVEGVLYGFQDKDCFIPELNAATKQFVEAQDLLLPNYKEQIEETFAKNNWFFKSIATVDVNAVEIVKEIEKADPSIVVFAGYGGQLLAPIHFESGLRYLHMHPGKLPIERGSTTIYYSILNQRNITVTAFYMTAQIDAGQDVIYKEYAVPNKGVDIDLWYDNIVRADCFVNALSAIRKKQPLQTQTDEESMEYYVIHPVLKHVALLSL